MVFDGNRILKSGLPCREATRETMRCYRGMRAGERCISTTTHAIAFTLACILVKSVAAVIPTQLPVEEDGKHLDRLLGSRCGEEQPTCRANCRACTGRHIVMW